MANRKELETALAETAAAGGDLRAKVVELNGGVSGEDEQLIARYAAGPVEATEAVGTETAFEADGDGELVAKPKRKAAKKK